MSQTQEVSLMRDTPIPADPAPAAESPPKKGAAPCGTAGSGERKRDSTNATEVQSHPLTNLCRAWMRAGTEDRDRFLSDIGAKIDDDATGERGR